MIYLLWAFGVSIFVGFGLIVLRGAPYVPTHRIQLKRAFTTLHPLSARDIVVDLGAGDGVVLDEAARRGARAIGYELNPWLWLVMKYRFRHSPQVIARYGDYTRLPCLPRGTTVVYAFTTSLGVKTIEQCLEKWSATQHFTFISYGFELPNRRVSRDDGPMHAYIF